MPDIQTPAFDALKARMHSYDGCYDGYPMMSETDNVLVVNALKEQIAQTTIVGSIAEELEADPYQLDSSRLFELVVFEAVSADQIRRSFDFMRDHMMSTCACALIESGHDDKHDLWAEFADSVIAQESR
jgi:hypothetical protein